MRLKRKTKDTIQKIVSVALVIATVVGIGALMGHFLSNNADENGRVKFSPSYEIGGLTDYGKYHETKESIYTKEAFKCDGLLIEPEFDSTITYQVFFYDSLGNFISSTDSLDGYYKEDIPVQSSHARIVITPEWESGIKESDKKINIFEINKYAKQLTIKVKAEAENSDYEEIAVFDDVKESFNFESASAYDRGVGIAPFVYKNLNYFEDSTITKIGVPVLSVSNYNQDNVLTVYVYNSTDFSNYVKKYELTIKANTFDNNTVNDWYYFENLSIRVEKGQTLAFFNSTDTVTPGYLKTNAPDKYLFYYRIASNMASGAGQGIFFDIYKAEKTK